MSTFLLLKKKKYFKHTLETDFLNKKNVNVMFDKQHFLCLELILSVLDLEQPYKNVG